MAVGLLVWRLVRHVPTDEERIQNMLDEMRLAAVDRSPAGILEHVSEDYRDDSGFGRDELRAYLTGYFLGSREVSVTVLGRNVELQGISASADLRVIVARDGRRDGRRIVLRMLREGAEDWKIQSSLNEPLLGQ